MPTKTKNGDPGPGSYVGLAAKKIVSHVEVGRNPQGHPVDLKVVFTCGAMVTVSAVQLDNGELGIQSRYWKAPEC